MNKEDVISRILDFNMSPAETYKMIQAAENIPPDMFQHIKSVSPTGIMHDDRPSSDQYRKETEDWNKVAEKAAEQKLQEDKEIAMAQDYTYHLTSNSGTGLVTCTIGGTDIASATTTNYPMYVHNDGTAVGVAVAVTTPPQQPLQWEQTENPNLGAIGGGMVFAEPHRAEGTTRKRRPNMDGN